MSNILDIPFNAVAPKLTIEIAALPDFTGRIIVNLEDGKLKSWYQPRPDELTANLKVFMELAKRAGWKVTPPEES